jgi:hypothetical protein
VLQTSPLSLKAFPEAAGSAHGLFCFLLYKGLLGSLSITAPLLPLLQEGAWRPKMSGVELEYGLVKILAEALSAHFQKLRKKVRVPYLCWQAGGLASFAGVCRLLCLNRDHMR